MDYAMKTINAKKIVKLLKSLDATIRNTEVIAYHNYGVHVTNRGMTEIAPLTEWTLNKPVVTGPGFENLYPYNHTIIIDGIEFFAMSSDRVSP